MDATTLTSWVLSMLAMGTAVARCLVISRRKCAVKGLLDVQFLASKAVIFGVNSTGPHILYVNSFCLPSSQGQGSLTKPRSNFLKHP
jgi:hypothetical protein